MIDELVPYRIQRIYNSSSPREKVYLKKILEEIAETGDSQTYRDIWLEDYIEIPVDIDTFICDDYYLGKTNRNGAAVYPYWRDFLRKLFHAGNKYEEVMLTGATRIGKSSTAITGTSYMLYKLMCLRDPQAYFGKKDISVFSILFFNLTKELAAGVAYREFQDTILASPWFCLVGSTEVLTDSGYRKIQDIAGQPSKVFTLTPKGVELVDSELVALTGYTDTLVEIELEDGSIISGTPDHRVLLSDGRYKCLKDITEEDDILMDTSEIFLPIPGYEGMYEISNLGRIKKIGGSNNKYGEFRKFNKHKRGYDSIDVSYKGVTSVEIVPELVMRTFYPDYPSDRFYLIGDIHDNSVMNIHPGRRELEGEWRDVAGTDGIIQVSSQGQLYCHTHCVDLRHRRSIVPEHFVKLQTDFDGYYYVSNTLLTSLGHHFLHRIVAETYLVSDSSLVVNHKDGNKKNNSVSNLEWVTVAQNNEHARNSGFCNFSKKSILECTTGTRFSGFREAAEYFNISIGAVRDSINNSKSVCNGLRFCCEG